ncbi:MAG: radical SAM protein [Armatimonadota bacterium]
MKTSTTIKNPLLAAERGTVYKPRGNKLVFALAFPNTYHVGMSSLGFQVVYRLLNELPDVVCERVFLPDPEERDRVANSRKGLTTLESGIPLREVDVLGFSVYFELDYANVAAVLRLAGLPPLARDRNEEHPLVVAGGPAVSINPEPLAEFVDVAAVGDGEELVPEMTARILKLGASCAGGVVDRKEMLKELAQVPGLYVPSLYRFEYDDEGRVANIEPLNGAPLPVKKRVTRDLSRYDVSSAIVTPNTEFGGMFLTEIARGCARGCRFCFAGYGYRPVRYRRTEDVHPLNTAKRGDPSKAVLGAARVGLVGSSLSDNPWCSEIAAAFAELGLEVNVSSVRAETAKEELMLALGKGMQRTLTLAPEAATDRLRRVIKKPLKDEHLHKAIASAAANGVTGIKLYFMIGLPTETEEDVEAICELCRRIMEEHSAKSGPGIRTLTVSVSPLVPKPFTPFQWHPMESRDALENKKRILEKGLKGLRGVKLVVESVRLSELQALLARGDRQLGAVLLDVADSGGSWKSALRRHGIDLEHHLRRERRRGEIFPWDVLDLGLDREMLWREYQLALRGLLTKDSPELTAVENLG